MTATRDMTEGKILRQVIPLAVPLLLTNMGHQLYMIVDGSIVVRALMGTAAVALFGTGAIFYAEPTAWVFALLFVLVPYYLVRRRVLRIETG
ncbi:MAG: hypothetical protein J6Y95_07885 [Lachnospiraceae bacterium]|nr:hypothetical protein [Lachnospiraceae bacterium]